MKMRKMTGIILTIMMIISMTIPFASTVKAEGNEIGSGPTDLQAAIDSAATGDTIYLPQGATYNAITIPAGKNLTIIGPSDKSTKIHNESNKSTVTITGSGAITLKNLLIDNITSSKGNSYCGIIANNVTGNLSLSVDNCIITANSYGINVAGVSTLAKNVKIDVANTEILQGQVTDYEKEAVVHAEARGVRLFNLAGSDSYFNLKNSKIMGYGYGINTSATDIPRDTEDMTITVDGSTINSWGCLNLWTTNTNIRINDSNLKGINTSTSKSNGFAVIVLNDTEDYPDDVKPSTLEITNTDIDNYIPDLEAAKTAGITEQFVRVENAGKTEITMKDTSFTDTTGFVNAIIYFDLPNGYTENEIADIIAGYTSTNVTAENITAVNSEGEVTPLAPIVAAESLALSVDKIEIKAGDTFDANEIVITPVPLTADSEVNWSIEDVTTASVSAEGIISGLKEGTTNLVATAKVGINDNGTMKYASVICPVIVKANNKPQLNDNSPKEVKEFHQIGEAYNITLSNYFTDKDDAVLSYEVSIDGEYPIPCDEAFSYKPDTEGEHVLVFRAFDGKLLSTDTLTVTLTVKDYIARAEDNSVAIEGDQVLQKGESFTIVAYGSRQNAIGEKEGETRYIPITVSVNPTADFVLEDSKYKAKLQIDEPGTYALSVTFHKEIWEDGEWRNTEEDALLQRELLITEIGNPLTPPAPAATPASASKASAASAKTGDSQVSVIILLILLGAAAFYVIGFAVNKKHKNK